MKGLCSVSALLAACLLVGCSSGGSSNPAPPPPPPPVPAPSGLSYPAPPAFTLGTAIAQLTPTVTGSPTSYAVAPALPAGLTLNTASGIVSGTPTALQPATNHTVTASNVSGSTTATLSITVNDVAPTLSYPRSSYTFTTAAPITPVTPTTGGGAITNWSIDHALPAGLTFNNGQISGTPAAVSAAANYVVTALNSGGSATYSLSLEVQSGVLLDLGHVQEITGAGFLGNRVMSVDLEGRVLLQDAQTGARVLAVGPSAQSCEFPCEARAQLAGDILVVRGTAGFDVYSAQTGALLAQIAAPPPSGLRSWKLSSDGSYVAEAASTGLSAWSVAGTSLLSRTGDYRTARLFAAPGQLRVANSPGNAQTIEYIALPSGASSLSPPYIGTFNSWFQDGGRFLTRANNNVVVYSQDGAQLDTAALTTLQGLGLDGSGNWYWVYADSTSAGQLRIFAVGGGGTPAATYTLSVLTRVRASGPLLAVIPYGERSISVIDLAGGTLQKTDLTTTTAYNTSFAARSAADWVFGNRVGVLSGSPGSALPAIYAHGRVRSIAGSSARTALTTSSGQIMVFDAARNLEETIAFNSSKVGLSSDGTVLGALAGDEDAQYSEDRTLRIYSLPSVNVLAEWPGVFTTTDMPMDFELSGNGEVVGRVTATFRSPVWDVTRRAVRLDDSLLWSDVTRSPSADLRMLLSQTGQRVAAPNKVSPPDIPGTNIYSNGTLSGAVSGDPGCWIDDTRLLVSRYEALAGVRRFTGVDIVNASGLVLASSALPELTRCQALSANTIYSPVLNVILDVNTGNTLWSSNAEASRHVGAATPTHVVFASGATVRAEPR